MTTNQVGLLSIGSNNANVGKSGKENVVAVDSTIGNKETKESNRDTKVGLEIYPNIATMTLVFDWPTTTIGTLVPVFPIPIFVYC